MLTAVSALAGCATGINTGKAEKQIATLVETQVGSKVKSVDCPSHETAKKGHSFTCVVTGADGTKGNAVVTDRDSKGKVVVDVPFVHTVPDAAAIVKDIKAKNPRVGNMVLTCPDIVPGKKGTTIDCHAKEGRGVGLVTITITDAQGSFDYKLRNGVRG